MTILAPTTDQQPADELRDRLDRLTSATADLTPGMHRLLVNSLNMLSNIADQTPGLNLDLGDWNQTHMHAMTVLENMETDRLAGQPYEAWGNQLKGLLATLAGIIGRALGDDQPEENEDEPQPLDPDYGQCSTCPCCSASDCENGECLDDRAGAPVCPCTSIDRAPRQPTSLLTPADVLDITEALQHAAANDCVTLDATDRQALALLTYWDGLDNMADRITISWLAQDFTTPLPLTGSLARALLRIISTLPAVSDSDRDAWRAARDAETPCVVDRIITALAGYTATRTGEDGCGLLNGAVQTAIRAGKPGILLDEVPKAASQAIGDALADLDADGLLPEPSLSPVDRALRISASQAAIRARNPRAGNVTAALKWTMRILIEETARGNTPYNQVTDADVQAAHERVTRLVEQAALRHNQPPAPDTLPDTEQIVTALAGLVADLSPQPGGHLLEAALRTAVRIARPDVPARQVETVADDLVEQARRELMAAEYGQTPAAVNAR
jgi:hypothetical protein